MAVAVTAMGESTKISIGASLLRRQLGKVVEQLLRAPTAKAGITTLPRGTVRLTTSTSSSSVELLSLCRRSP
jgi:hypothetical protein